jgi:Xaa-Pro aminopeptidase
VPIDVRSAQEALRAQGLDAWLLFDFHGVNPTAVGALDLQGRMLTRRWFYLLPAQGEPVALVHAIELLSFPPEVPGARASYSSWASLKDALGRLFARLPARPKIAMEYFPMAAIPYLSRVDAGTIELVRSYGVEVTSSAALVQHFLCRWGPEEVESHRRALAAIDAAKDAAFERIGERLRAGAAPSETELQAFLVERFAEAGLETDHPPIVAVNAHAGDPHYEPSERTPTPIRKGDLVLIDLWARGKGPRDVYADITWMAFCGDAPPEKHRRVFEVVAGARDVGLATCEAAHRAGRTLQGWEVDRAVRDFIASRGYGERFIHRTGHSIGRNVHGDGANLDDLETHDTRPLVPGLCFSIEPGVYLPDEGLGVRSEIDVFLAEDGPKVFSKIQRELVRIAC